MIEINVPGLDTFRLGHIVLDFNGTMATDGILIEGVMEKLNFLSRDLAVHILTADTFGTVREACSSISATVTVLTQGNGAQEKEDFVRTLGENNVVAVGNGMNDRMMLRTAALGILIVGKEGASGCALSSADIIVGSILDALDLLIKKKRVIATLRS